MWIIILVVFSLILYLAPLGALSFLGGLVIAVLVKDYTFPDVGFIAYLISYTLLAIAYLAHRAKIQQD